MLIKMAVIFMWNDDFTNGYKMIAFFWGEKAKNKLACSVAFLGWRDRIWNSSDEGLCHYDTYANL